MNTPAVIQPLSAGNEASGRSADRPALPAIRSLRAVLAISLFGTAFSGTLTYRELFGNSVLSCPSPGAPGTIFGYPACVYGLFMYATIAVVSMVGLRRSRLHRHSPAA
jgi:hypothetical protein